MDDYSLQFKIIIVFFVLILTFSIYYEIKYPFYYEYIDIDGNTGIANNCSSDSTKLMGKVLITETTTMNCQIGNKTIMVKYYEFKRKGGEK